MAGQHSNEKTEYTEAITKRNQKEISVSRLWNTIALRTAVENGEGYLDVVLTVIGYSFAYLHRLHFLASSFCIQWNY
jgi:hypothetical protein